MDKTIAMKKLDKLHIDYEVKEYDENITEGTNVADALKEDVHLVYKTLVLQGSDKHYYVYVIPVDKRIDEKRFAEVIGIKSCTMIPQKELLPLTGYVHGGCSPIAMKKAFHTFFDESMKLLDYVYISGGKKGKQIKIKPKDLLSLCTGIYINCLEIENKK